MGERYDLVVIGAGGAGSTAAGEARGRGAKVALIERWKVGGTCLNAGCDPTKTLVRSAEVFHLARQGHRFGFASGQVVLDWPAVIDRVNRVIDAIRGGDGDQNIRNMGTDLYKGHARFRSPHEIEVSALEGSPDGSGTAVIRGDKVIVATGARERPSGIAGLTDVGYVTNLEAVGLPALPRSLAIVGGGVIAVEFAQIFARFGVDVTVLGSAPRLLPKEDGELTEALRAVLEREGIRVETGVRVRRAWREGGLKVLAGQRDGETVECRAEEVLVAAGRQPTVEGLGLEAAGVAYDARIGVRVDEQLQTTAPDVWAIGDVINHYPYTHVADYQARIAEHNALSGQAPKAVDYRAVPWATFTDPELARVGLTEAEAITAGYDVRLAVVQMKDLARAITSGETDGLVKLVAERRSGRLLGGHVLAARGGELLGEIALAIRLGIPVAELAETIHAYPTLSEAVFWAAFELAKPDDPALEAMRGIQTPAGDVPDDM
jgi:pyruvate/2-oxoglutarate dehydrogenase complex dihydrolipoamide dehydrogenase (E3) component